MNYFLDVNALIAWGWADHPQNRKVDRWITGMMESTDSLFHTSSIVELGFVRVSMQRSNGQISISEATEVLRGQRDRFGDRLRLLSDDISSCREFPSWCTKAKDTTDSHLLALAEKHHLKLATLDTGIPGAFIIPS
jgi:predicted nucleic acid-binding protein